MKWWTLVYVFDTHTTEGHHGRMPVILAKLRVRMSKGLDYWTDTEGC